MAEDKCDECGESVIFCICTVCQFCGMSWYQCCCLHEDL